MLQRQSRIGRLGPGNKFIIVHRSGEQLITLFLRSIDDRARANVTQHRGVTLPALATHQVYGGTSAGRPHRVERVDVPVAGGDKLERVTIVEVLDGQFSVDVLSASEHNVLMR